MYLPSSCGCSLSRTIPSYEHHWALIWRVVVEWFNWQYSHTIVATLHITKLANYNIIKWNM
jgi:hypothetical protein